MRLLDHYDWVVLGDHPAALLSAGLMARMNHSVLVVPMLPSLQFTSRPDGGMLDPEPNYLLGLGASGRSSGLLSLCVRALDDQHLTTHRVRRGEDVFPQILTPSSRVEVSHENLAFRHELQRELGLDLAEALDLPGALEFSEPLTLEFWNRYPRSLHSEYRGSARRRRGIEAGRIMKTLHRHLTHQSAGSRGGARQWFAPHLRVSALVDRLAESAGRSGASLKALEEICTGFWAAATSADNADPMLLDLIHLLSATRTGAAFEGGVSAFRRVLVELARQHGAQISSTRACRRLFVEDGRLAGVQLEGRGQMISAGAGILGTALSQIRDYIIETGPKRTRMRTTPSPQGWRFTVSMVVYAEAIPPGMSSRAIWKEKDAPPIEVEVAAPGDYHLGGEQLRLVSARTWLPYRQDALDVDHQRLIASRMFRQLTELLPFLEFHIVRIYPDFRADPGERDDFSDAYGFAAPGLIPENLLCYAGDGVGCFSGVEGLYVASGESYPRLGTLGGTAAALEAMTDYLARSENADSKDAPPELWSFLR